MNRTPDKLDRDVYQDAAVMLSEHTSHPGISELLRYVCSRLGRAFVCAGAVRDCLYSALGARLVRPRDIDIGVDGLSKEEFSALRRMFDGVQNEYGGYSVDLGPEMKVDVWCFEDTVGTRLHGCESTLNNVLRSFVLDINAVAFEPATGEFCDMGALAALRSRTIGLVPSALVHSEPNFAARAAVLAARFSFGLSDDLRQLVASNLSDFALHHQLKKYRLTEMPLADATADLGERFELDMELPLAASSAAS